MVMQNPGAQSMAEKGRKGVCRKNGEEPETVTSVDPHVGMVRYQDKYYYFYFIKKEIADIKYDILGLTSGISP